MSNDTTTETFNEQRIQRTYRVALHRDGEEPIATAIVNLSYKLNDTLQAVNGDTVIEPDSLEAKAEVARRLRRLAQKGNAGDLTTDMLDTDGLAWDMDVVRTSFVNVLCDAATGRPLPRKR